MSGVQQKYDFPSPINRFISWRMKTILLSLSLFAISLSAQAAQNFNCDGHNLIYGVFHTTVTIDGDAMNEDRRRLGLCLRRHGAAGAGRLLPG